MNASELEQQVYAAHGRLNVLRQRAGGPPRPELLAQAAEEVSVSLEELHVALEELHQQNAELMATREALEVERLRYQELFEFAPSGYLVTDSAGVIKESNLQMAAMLQRPQRFLIGKLMVLFVAEPYRKAFLDLLTRLESGESAEKWDFDLLCGDGRVVPAGAHTASTRDAAGGVVDLHWLVHDVSEEKQAQEALRASEERYRGLFETANDIVFTLDAQGNFTSLNRAGERVSGYTRDEALTMNYADIVAPEYTEEARSLIAGQARDGPPLRYMEMVAKDGGRVALEISTRPVFKRGRMEGLHAIARDETERRRLEEELRQAQKLEAIGRLAGGIAHDFNNALTAILGYGELLMVSLAAGSQAQTEEVGEILCAAHRAERLTSQLLAFSRKQMLQPKVLDLNAIVTGLERMLRQVIPEDIEISITLEPELPHVKADQSSIEQVILNLVVNGRDAMPKGGILTIETSTLEVDGDLSKNLGLPLGKYVILRVSDSGCGMNAETLAHAFEPFFTTKEVGKGTGLGLPSAYGTVKQSNGYMFAASEPDKGTAFTIYLPALDGVAEPSDTVSDLNPLERGSGTVLVVEDEGMIRRLILQVLADNGYTVLVAAGGAEAIQISEEHDGPIDLLLTDVVMPQIGGRESAQRLLAARPDIKVVFMSGHTGETIINHGVIESDPALLKKPFTPYELLRKVREVLAS